MIQKGTIRSIPVINEALVPLAFLEKKAGLETNAVILAGDVGGTKTRLLLVRLKERQLTIINEKSYQTREYQSLVQLFRSFLDKDWPAIDGICLGVAGPVNEGKVQGTNFPWEITAEEIKKELQCASVLLMNDLEANAYGLAALEAKDFEILKSGSNIAGNAAVLSVGTGLGEAGLYWDGARYHPFATEGGHCDFSPRNELDVELWRFLQKKYGHVSWERVLSGPGISHMHDFLRHYRGQTAPPWLQKELLEEEDAAKVITKAALERKDAVCVETLELFVRFLAVEAAQLALKTKATGGIYMGGGIIPKILKGIDRDLFCKNFVQVGRLSPLLEKVPVRVVLNEKTALLGAAYYGAMAYQNKGRRKDGDAGK
jgi:glucokinase